MIVHQQKTASLGELKVRELVTVAGGAASMPEDKQGLAFTLIEEYAKWSNEQDIDIRIAAARSEEAMLQLMTVVILSFAEAIAPEEKVASVARRMTDVFIAKLNAIDWDSAAKQLMTDD